MRIQMEPTEMLTTVDGVQVRVWNGVTEAGVQCFVFVHRLMVRDGQDMAAFEREFHEMPAPQQVKVEVLGS